MSKTETQLGIRAYQSQDERELIRLWQACDLLVPWNNPYRDIERKCGDSPGLFFVGEFESELVASCMAGYDGHRGWLYYLAVLPGYRGRGFAKALVARAEQSLRALGCAKLELMVRDSNEGVISFYQGQGYEQEPVSVLSKRLLTDESYEPGDTIANE